MKDMSTEGVTSVSELPGVVDGQIHTAVGPFS